ncbi:helicase C-terminal domain-containing protein [Hyaloraphidium curvatum]|nr:helicase C-terminal domain-containing protein [Hyaloraphidium curvatum]
MLTARHDGVARSATAAPATDDCELVPLPTPSNFAFPFPPYPIQLEFMTSLYTAIEAKKQVAIFESPTGTGKSLSLLCGSLRWLKDNQQRMVDAKRAAALRSAAQESTNVADTLRDDDEPDWVVQQSKARVEAQKLALVDEEIAREQRRKEYLQSLRLAEKAKGAKESRERAAKRQKLDSNAEDDFAVDDYESDEDDARKQIKKILSGADDDDKVDQLVGEDGEEPDEIKIFYCSRTHSQLSQVVNEIKKTAYGADICNVSLASRKNTCIHPRVSRYKSVARINDACLDLQKDKNGCCSYLKDKPMHVFRDHAHATVQDIEELVAKGRQLAICPYYGTRSAIRSSEIVTLPYNLLLQKSSRQSLGLSVKGHVVIIDEAHNLIDTVQSIYSVSVTLSQILLAHKQLTAYFEKYKPRLNGQNVMYIQQILSLLVALRGFAEARRTSAAGAAKGNGAPESMWTINDFGHGLRIDNINLFKVQTYLQQSRLAQKLQGFTEKQADGGKKKPDLAEPDKADDDDYVMKHVSALGEVERFVMCLTDADVDGRIIMARNDPVELKYMLLNPANAIRDVVEEARIVILAGGTMEPVSDLLMQLFPYLPDGDIARFSCGHVIPPSSLHTTALATGPSGMAMDFTYQNRSNVKLIDELGQIVVNAATIVPAGMVCFFVSYAYMESVVRRWSETETIKRLEKRKRVFFEPRDAGQVDAMLREYATHVAASSASSGKDGAILFAVVGGKMSEGINFSDDLGRCVIMVGLPFPNSGSVEIREKMSWLKSSRASEAEGNAAASDYYENLCMRAVNQSIGRAIRHQNDYASILLVDKRYQSARIQRKIPLWISSHMVNAPSFGAAFSSMGQFFKSRRTNTLP